MKQLAIGFLLTAGLAAAAGCGHGHADAPPPDTDAAKSPEPAETIETAQARHDRRVDYLELGSTDLEATKEFYSAVFGWSFTDFGPTYTSFEDGRLAGGFALADSIATGGVLVVIYAADLEAILGDIESHGGAISRSTFDFPGGRRFHFRDPSGNELAVWSDR